MKYISLIFLSSKVGFFTYYKFWFERYPFHVFDNTRSINIILTSKDINNNLAKFVVNALLVKRNSTEPNINWLVPNRFNDQNIKSLTRNLYIILKIILCLEKKQKVFHVISNIFEYRKLHR